MTRNEKLKTYIEELVKNSLDWEHDPAGVVWTVEELTHAGRIVRLIVCNYLRWSPQHKLWGSSDLAEEEGPAARSCPLRFFDLVPEEADPDWREGVTRWHRDRAGTGRTKGTL